MRTRLLIAVGCLVAIACGRDLGRDSSPQEDVAVIDCVNGYDDAQVPPGSTIVLDAVALPTARALQVNPSGRVDGMLWSKDGLIVATGKELELRVADDWQGRLAFNWGRPSDPVEQIRVPACARRGGSQWLAFTGGYFVTEPGCVAVIVSSEGAEERVEIGIGAPCAGQEPPASPPRPS